MASYSLAVDVGAVVVYSQSIVFQRGKALPVDAGSFALSGQAVALERAQNVARGTFSLGGQSVQFIAPGSVTFATIVNGIVTSIDTGFLPPSTNDTLYFDLTGYSLPSIGWYFSEVCQEFTATIPVAPPGSIAPPFTPGGEPPDITDPGGNGNDGGPEEPGPPVYATTIPMLLAFHARKDNTFTVTTDGVAGPDDLTELSVNLRTAFELRDVCAVRVQTEVIDAAGGNLVLCFSLDGGATWERASLGDTGPKVNLSAVGNAVGAFTNIKTGAAGSSILSLFVTPTAAGAVLGNTAVVALVAVNEGLCVEIDELSPCVLVAEYPIYAEDFSTYATYEAFIAARQYPSDPDFWNLFSDLFLPATSSSKFYLDPTTFIGDSGQSLVMKYNAADYPSALFTGWITLFEAQYSDVVLQWVLFMDLWFDVLYATDGVTALGSADSAKGFVFGAWEDKAPSGEGGGRYFHYLLNRGGKVYHEVWNGGFNVQAPVELGDMADFLGDFKQFTVRADYSGSNARLRLYLDQACPNAPATPTLWATATGPRVSTNSKWRSVECATVYESTPPDEAKLFTFQYSYSNDATIYGF